MTMNVLDAFHEEFGYRIKDKVTPEVYGIMLDAFNVGYGRADLDSKRYRFIRDEVVQDAAVSPFCIGVGILDSKPNVAGNYDIKLWAAAWDVSADKMLDSAIALWEQTRGSNVAK